MKTRVFWKWRAGLALLFLPLAGGCLQEATSSSEMAAPINIPENESVRAAEPAPEEIADVAGPPTSATSDAPVSVVSTEAPLPPNVKPTAPTAELIKLAESGVDLSVMLAFVTNSASTFNLSSDDIVYLNDLGVPSTVIAGMLQRDQALKENLTNLAAKAAEPPPQPALQTPGATPSASSQAPEEIAQTEFPTENYPAPQPAEAVDANFYDSLAPYGNWVDVDGYGQCWRPTVGVINVGWQPYFDSGRWVYTDCGWYWMSDYSWGWAPFHYGRWFRHNGLGWCWAPGTVWGPSWVCWRYADNYCGWAPLPPSAGFTAGIGLTLNGQRVSPFFGFGLAANCFPFVPLRNLCDHNPRRHVVPASQVAAFYNQTVAFAGVVPRNHTVFNHGVAPERVAAVSQTQIRPVTIHEVPSAPRNGFREHFEAHNTALATFRLDSSQLRAKRLANAGDSRIQSRADFTPSTPAFPSQTAPLQSAQRAAADSRPSSSQHFVIRGERWGAASHGDSAQRNSLAQTSNRQADQAGIPAQPTITPSRSQSSAQQAGQSVLNDRQTLAGHRETMRAHAEQYSRYDAAPVAASPHQTASPAHHSSFEALRLSSASGAPAQRPHPVQAAGRHETQPVVADDQSEATPRPFSIPTRQPFAGVSHHRAAPAAIPENVQAAPLVEQRPVAPAPAPEVHSSPPSAPAPAPAAPSAPPSRGPFRSSSNRPSR